MATIADRSDFLLELEFTRIYRENAVPGFTGKTPGSTGR